MKKTVLSISLFLGLLITSIHADALKNSLSNMLEKKETSSIVDLGQINLDGKPKHIKKVRKTRSSKTVIATINGYKLIKKKADIYLSERTKGKIKNFDLLPLQQRKRLIKEMAFPILAIDAAKKELSEQEKSAIYTRMWIQIEAQKLDIPNEDVIGVYNILKAEAEKRKSEQNITQENNATKAFPAFQVIAAKIKGQMIEKKLVDNIMKDVKIKIAE